MQSATLLNLLLAISAQKDYVSNLSLRQYPEYETLEQLCSPEKASLLHEDSELTEALDTSINALRRKISFYDNDEKTQTAIKTSFLLPPNSRLEVQNGKHLPTPVKSETLYIHPRLGIKLTKKNTFAWGTKQYISCPPGAADLCAPSDDYSIRFLSKPMKEIPFEKVTFNIMAAPDTCNGLPQALKLIRIIL